MMFRHGLMLCVALGVGCAQSSMVDVESAPPSPASTNFDRLPLVLAGIQAGEVLLYRGLPSQFWEPQLREQELREKKTMEIHGYPVYEELFALETSDAEQLTAMFSTQTSFKKYQSNKRCSGFNPDFCLQWNSGDGSTVALISLECGEVEIFGPKGELHCDFSEEVAARLRTMLADY